MVTGWVDMFAGLGDVDGGGGKGYGYDRVLVCWDGFVNGLWVCV